MKTYRTRAIAILSLLFVFGLASKAFATIGGITGTVYVLVPQDTTYGNSYFQVASSATVGTCVTDGTRTLMLIPDNDRGKQMFAVVQSALLSGKNVSVQLDDTVTVTGSHYCYARSVLIAP